MRRCFGLLALAWSAAAAQAIEAPAIEAVVRDITRKVVQVVGAQGLGSAVLVAPDRAVTSCHVIGAAREVLLVLGAQPQPAPVLARDALHDLCVLGLPAATGHRPASCRASDLLSLGETNWAVGFASGRLGFSRGVLLARYAMDGGHVLRTSAGFLPGASGGGLFDAEGRLVGVLTALRRGGTVSAYLAVPCQWVLAVLAGADAAPAMGAPFWQLTGGAAPLFMQALALEADGRWQALLALAQRWQAAAPGDEAAAAMLDLARSQGATEGALLVLLDDADCALHGGRRVLLQRSERAPDDTVLRVWIERWFMGRRSADRSRHDLGPAVELGCSRTASGDEQHWEIIGSETRPR